MLRLLLLVTVLVVFAILAAPRSALTNASGPSAGYTGAPGDGTCLDCHGGFPLNSGGGSVSINAPETYTPGQTITLGISVTNSNSSGRQGFQVTILDGEDTSVGTFQITEATNTQLVGDDSDYVTHRFGGTFTTSWEMEWVAPATNVGPVTVYASGLGADGDGGTSGDRVYTATATIAEPNAAPTLTNPIADQALQVGGEDFTVDLNDVFDDADALTFGASAMPSGVVSASVNGGLLTVTGTAAGSAEVTVTASDGVNAEVDDAFTVTVTEPNTDAETGALAERFTLASAWPNPFRVRTVLSFDLPVAAAVGLRVFDIRGREVHTLAPRRLGAGPQQVDLDGAGLGAGTYVFHLTAALPTGPVTRSGRVLRVR